MTKVGYVLAVLGLWVAPAAMAGGSPVISATIRNGDAFAYPIGRGLFLRLVPVYGSWKIEVGPTRGDDYAALVTPPYHGPNALDIEGWHFTPDGKEWRLELGRVRHFQFALTAADSAVVSDAVNLYLYGPGMAKQDFQRERLRISKTKLPSHLGTCWFKPERVTLAGDPKANYGRDLIIQTLHFTAQCAFSGSHITWTDPDLDIWID